MGRGVGHALAGGHVAGPRRSSCSFKCPVSLGLVAYPFGLRHAMDADHIAAILTPPTNWWGKGNGRRGLDRSFPWATRLSCLHSRC